MKGKTTKTVKISSLYRGNYVEEEDFGDSKTIPYNNATEIHAPVCLHPQYFNSKNGFLCG